MICFFAVDNIEIPFFALHAPYREADSIRKLMPLSCDEISKTRPGLIVIPTEKRHF